MDNNETTTLKPMDSNIKKKKKENPYENHSESKQKNPNWRVEEDKSLFISWLNTSKDPIIGNNQSAKDEDKKNTKSFKPFPTRLQNALECRWSTIQHRVNKFCGYVTQVERRQQSGCNQSDAIVEAKELYRAEQGSCFTLDHFWGLLFHSPKWVALMEENIPTKPKSKLKDTTPTQSVLPSQSDQSETNTTAGSTEHTNSISVERPEGRKVAKRKREDGRSTDGMSEQYFAAQQSLIKASERKANSLELVADDLIMSKDTSGMDELAKEFYAMKKREILERIKTKCDIDTNENNQQNPTHLEIETS